MKFVVVRFGVVMVIVMVIVIVMARMITPVCVLHFLHFEQEELS